MKKRLLLTMCVLFTISVYGQEDKNVTMRLEEKYGTAFYTNDFYYNIQYYTIYKGEIDRKSRSGNVGICDTKGKEIIPPIWDHIQIFSNNNKYRNEKEDIVTYFKVRKDGKEGVRNMKNKEIIPCKYEIINFYSPPSVKFSIFEVIKDRKVGLLDIKGKVLLPCDFSTLLWLEYENPLMTIGKGGEGVNVEKEPIFGDLSARPANFVKGAKYALYDNHNKKFITDFNYDYIDHTPIHLFRFNKGGTIVDGDAFNPVVEGGKWGFMDENGKEIISAQYDMASRFDDGLAQVTKDGVTSLIVDPILGTKMKIGDGIAESTVDKDIPDRGSRINDNTFAFIFATENYSNLYGANFAINDGKLFVEYCKKTIGIPDNNVRYFEDATYGNIVSAIKKMKNIADVYDGEARIILYFAGLGAVDSKTKEKYLLPSDATMDAIASTGYSLTKLQEDLNEMQTELTFVILDAPFSNVDRTGKTLGVDRGIQIKSKEVNPKGNVLVCLGSSDGETAFANKDLGHGMFTYALLLQLKETKGESPMKEWVEKAARWVSKESLDLFDKKQTPVIYVSSEMGEKWKNLKIISK